MDNPIFLLGSHKSGTSLLRSLLDGSKELFVVPVEAHFFQYSGHWIDYPLRRSFPTKPTFDELVESFTRHIRESNERASEQSDSVLTGRWNVDDFAAYLRGKGATRYESFGLRGFLDGYIEAMHVSLYGKPPMVKRFVEKSVENAEYAMILKKFYPGAKFIHLIRNPYGTLVAIRKYMTREHYPYLGVALAALNNSYYCLYKNRLFISDYKVLRYEDLVARPRETMHSITRFIGIEFENSLLEPTLMGSPWAGNSTSGQQFRGISFEPLAAWQRDIHPLEVDLVNRLFGHVLQDYGYKRLERKASMYWPARNENVISYLTNRWLSLLVAHFQFHTHLTENQ